MDGSFEEMAWAVCMMGWMDGWEMEWIFTHILLRGWGEVGTWDGMGHVEMLMEMRIQTIIYTALTHCGVFFLLRQIIPSLPESRVYIIRHDSSCSSADLEIRPKHEL